ncbi:MAG: hypothetical protein QOJ13_449 [Gaiellales bacterium]|jgi:hypothetical protein|nr:hypothetical protein [Gaiellales bacterium]
MPGVCSIAVAEVKGGERAPANQFIEDLDSEHLRMIGAGLFRREADLGEAWTVMLSL